MTRRKPIPATEFILSDSEHGAILSDHMPVTHMLPGYGRVFSWNILTQCWATRSKTGKVQKNNAFEIAETDKQYKERLIRIADTIRSEIAKHPDFCLIALQETPAPPPTFSEDERENFHVFFCKTLEKALSGSMWVIGKAPFLRMQNHRFGNLLLYNKEVFKSLEDITLRINLGTQSGRALIVDLTPRSKEAKPLRFANVHFNWGTLVRFEVRHAIDLLVRSSDDMPLCIAGDHNTEYSFLNLEHLEDVELKTRESVAKPLVGAQCNPNIDFFILANFNTETTKKPSGAAGVLGTMAWLQLLTQFSA